jgi:hypothetical protein
MGETTEDALIASFIHEHHPFHTNTTQKSQYSKRKHCNYSGRINNRGIKISIA